MRTISWLRNRPRRGQRGNTAVEFALVFPVLMTFLFGAIDGGRYTIAHSMLSYATIVGGRMASMPSTANATTVQTAVVNAAPFLGLTTASVTVTVKNGATVKTFATRAVGDTVTVSTLYNYKAFVTFFSKMGSRTFTASSAVPFE